MLRERLLRIDLLASISGALENLAQQASDTGLHLGEITRPPLLLAYAIGRGSLDWWREGPDPDRLRGARAGAPGGSSLESSR